MKIQRRGLLFVAGLVAWLLLSGSFDWQHLAVGFVVSAIVALVTGDMFASPYLLKKPSSYLWFLYYIPVFLWECLKANIDVAYRVIHPKVPLNPGIVKVKTTLKSDTALTFLANSITLTPGTLTVDIDKGKGILYVHWIDVIDKDIKKTTALIAGRFEPIIKRIFT